ncbi:MAG: hypothetical protein PHY93_08475 [Bacteriovorax sp.]|nr:hypothetical protein [Bacteriovorax sp.]
MKKLLLTFSLLVFNFTAMAGIPDLHDYTTIALCSSFGHIIQVYQNNQKLNDGFISYELLNREVSAPMNFVKAEITEINKVIYIESLPNQNFELSLTLDKSKPVYKNSIYFFVPEIKSSIPRLEKLNFGCNLH